MLNNDKIHYCIVGEGELYNNLIILVKALNLERNVHFYGYRDDVEKFYKIANVFCFPSYRGGLSVSLIEAMSCNLPIICSNIRGNIDLVKNEQGGYLCNPNIESEFCVAIEKLFEREDLRETMGDFNFNISRKFDLAEIDKKMSSIYKSIKN